MTYMQSLRLCLLHIQLLLTTKREVPRSQSAKPQHFLVLFSTLPVSRVRPSCSRFSHVPRAEYATRERSWHACSRGYSARLRNGIAELPVSISSVFWVLTTLKLRECLATWVSGTSS